jgi:hypothetical protein
MSLNRNEYIALAEALTNWANAAPDEPALGFLQTGEMLTRSQLLDTFDDPENADGAALLEMLEHAVRREGVNSVTNRIYQSMGQHENG